MKFDDGVMNRLPTPEQVDRMAEVFYAIEDLLKILPVGNLEDHDHLDADLKKLCVEAGKSLYKKYGIIVKFPTEIVDADGSLCVEDYPFENGEEEKL